MLDEPRILVQVIELDGKRNLVIDLRGEYIPPAAVIELSGSIDGHQQDADPPPS